jgi:hypothetical protein
MLKRTTIILFFLILSVVLAYVYFQYRIPTGVVSQGDGQEAITWVSLIASIVSLITALVGLIEKIVDKKQ